jgi:hypothetical protein
MEKVESSLKSESLDMLNSCSEEEKEKASKSKESKQ